MSTSHGEGGLDRDTEVALFHQAQAGCRDSLNRLMARHHGLVLTVVRQQILADLPFDEALQAGRIGLWHAILGFDPQRGWAFSTYAYPCIRHQLWRAVKAHTRFWARPDRSYVDSVEPAADPARLWQQAVVRQALQELVGRLPERLREVIVARYDLDGQGPTLYRHIGARLGVTGERARQLHTEALVWLRHPGHSYHLRSLLGCHTQASYELAQALAQQWLRRRGGRRGR